MKRKSLAAVLTVLTMLSACTSGTTASENDELIDDLSDEFSEEIFDDMPVIPDSEKSGAELSETDESDEIFDDTTIIGENEASEENNISEEIVTEISEAEDKTYTDLLDHLPNDSIKNKAVKFLSYYDPWNGDDTPYEKYAAALFSEKYGGEIEWYPTTYNYFFSDLSTYIIGGQSMDIIPEADCFPKSIINGWIQSYDNYVDWESPIWSSVRDINDTYAIGGRHYMIACHAEEECVVFYNKNIIRENGYDDPWELYKNGKWTMSKFTSMLEDYVDEKHERYGLRGLFNVTPLTLASGKIPVSFENGRLVNNLSDPDLDRAMNHQYELYEKGLMSDFMSEVAAGNYLENYIADGKSLFCISHAEAFSSMGNSEDVGLVPIPKDDLADKYYHSASLEAYDLCVNSDNPEGTIRLMECLIASYNDDRSKARADAWYRNEYGWTDEFFERRDEISRLAGKNPVVEICYGFPEDASSMVIEKIYTPLQTADLDSIKNRKSDELDMLIEEINAQLAAIQN